MNLDEYKLKDDERKIFIEKQAIILNDAERLNEYQNFVSSQKSGFLQLMNFINSQIMQHKKLR